MGTNSTSEDPTASADAYANIELEVLIGTSIVLLFAVARPLWTLGQQRVALLLIFSKSCASVLFLLLELCSIPQCMQAVLQTGAAALVFNALSFGLSLSINLHLFAMALNRVHCILLPFNYIKFVTKSTVFWECMAIHCACLGFSVCANLALPSLSSISGAITGSVLSLWMVCLLCYVMVAVRLAWIKFKKSAPSLEKAYVKISVSCMSGMLVLLFGNLVVVKAAHYWPDNEWALQLEQIMAIVLIVFPSISEEICLGILCRDFRVQIRDQFAAIFRRFAPSNRQVGTIGTTNAVTIQVRPAATVHH